MASQGSSYFYSHSTRPGLILPLERGICQGCNACIPGVERGEEIFCRQLKQTARIYHMARKYGFGDYTPGIVGKMTENIRSYLRIFFSIFGLPGWVAIHPLKIIRLIRN